MLAFLGAIIAIAAAAILGAKYHVVINEKLNKLLHAQDELPPDFRAWLAYHKGEYPTLGSAMAAWADAKFGTKYDQLVR